MFSNELLINTIKNDLIDSMEPQLTSWESSAQARNLGHFKIAALADYICQLPQSGQEILLGTYAFDFTAENIEILYSISKVNLRRIFFENILSARIGLCTNECISQSSMHKACKKAMKAIANEDNYKNKGTIVIRTFAKAVAAIIVIGILSFSTAMAVNADFRETVSKWFIETFTEYSIFRFNGNDTTSSDLHDYKITYIPSGFTYLDCEELDGMIFYTYEDDDEDYISIDIQPPDVNNFVDTEDTTMELFDFNGVEARYYHKDDYSLIVTTIDEYALFISGPMDKDEIMKIAYGIQK